MTEDAEELVWHYTDTAGLIGILTKHELWASSTSFLNDPQEDEYALDLLAEALKGLPDGVGEQATAHYNDFRREDLYAPAAYSKRYVACASRKGDLLEMWRAYGAGGVEGTFAVGLDKNVELGVVCDKENPLQLPGTHATVGWQNVDYTDSSTAGTEARTRLLDGLKARGTATEVQWDVADEVLEHLQRVAKAPAYDSEREVRLTVEDVDLKLVHLRASRFGPVPYIRLTGGASAWGELAPEAQRLPVRAIRLWPGAPQQALLGVIAALDEGGHGHRHSRNAALMASIFAYEENGRKIEPVDILRSEIPYV